MPPHRGLSRWQQATALVPLVVLSAAWTTSLVVTDPAGGETSTQQAGLLRDGTPVPDRAIASASADAIPATALSAYQRAARVVDAADGGCHVGWTLIAAIGRVESNHGRLGGNTMAADGVSRLAIYGSRLDGSHETAHDRAAGPMQLTPSAWSVIGVDGDGDGERDPQDIDDAALATAVYLCSGDEDLSGTAGRRSAVYRYNHDNDYVNLVLSVTRAYAAGDFTSVPTRSAETTTFARD